MVLGMGSPVSAATVEIIKHISTGVIVRVDGDLALEDGEKFAATVRPLQGAVILLNSPGGSLMAGLRIGEIVRSRNFSTVVLDDDLCASACAIAWLGGRRRYLAPKARLGFHAAYSNDGGGAAVSGAGNALVGAYLDRLGLSDETIFELTEAGPAGMLWLDVPTANQLGIAAKPFALEDVSSTPAIAPNAPTFPAQRAVEFVHANFSAGSADAASALAWIGSHYGKSIDYYGRAVPFNAVLAEKRAYVQRWPERVYIPAEKALAVNCAPGGRICRVSGTVQYECRSYSRGAYAGGLASFAMTIDMTGASPIVISEDGRVLVRR